MKVIAATHTGPIWLHIEALARLSQCTSEIPVKDLELEEMGLQFTTENIPDVANSSKCVAEDSSSRYSQLGVSSFCQADFCC